jgi:beta-mannanase
MTVNMVVLVTFTGWVYWAANSQGDARHAAANRAAASTIPGATSSTAGKGAGVPGAKSSTSTPASASASPSPTHTTATAAQIESEPGKYFGVTSPDVPFSAPAFTDIAKSATVSPNMIEYYVNWTQSFNSVNVFNSYADGALPVITWEPFNGGTTGNTNLDQPAYALSTIIDGKHDTYITQFAEAVKAAKVPIAIRFMHEMNGNWYPWSIGVNGNTSAEYVAAWKHVWNVFQTVGATNVIWIWAPNVLRGAQNDVKLADVYPGDQYVNWIGMSAYEDYESTATQLLNPTLDDIRQFTQKDVLITETGAQPNTNKVAWITNFLQWLPQQQNVIGFIWNEYTLPEGARAAWGFDADPESLQAFRTGIRGLQLAAVPTP